MVMGTSERAFDAALVAALGFSVGWRCAEREAGFTTLRRLRWGGEQGVGGGFAVWGRPLAPVLADSSPPEGRLLARSRSGLAPTPLAAREVRYRL